MFTERWPHIVEPNPGGPNDPLGESVLDELQPWLRVFEPRDTRVIVGRTQDPTRECWVEHAKRDQVAIHRRASGGGAVVLAPGMVVVTCRLRGRMGSPDAWVDRVNQPLMAAVRAAGGPAVSCTGLGDLVVPSQPPRKVLGSSLRQRRDRIYYLGVFLVTEASLLMDRYLQRPSREPDYRAGRDHAGFCAALHDFGVSPSGLIESVTNEMYQAQRRYDW